MNFATESYSIPHRSHPDAPRFPVLCKLFHNLILHREIREKGGAYGSGCKYSEQGALTFFSYRDPNHMKTYEIF